MAGTGPSAGVTAAGSIGAELVRVVMSWLRSGWSVVALSQFVGLEAAVDAVRHDGLTRLEGELAVVEVHLDEVGFERHPPRHRADLGPRLRVGPTGALALTDVVVAGQTLVRAERLPLDRCQGGGVDVLTADVPARREARFVERERTSRVGDDSIAVADDEVPRGPPMSMRWYRSAA